MKDTLTLTYQSFLTRPQPGQRVRTVIDHVIRLTVSSNCAGISSKLYFVISCRIPDTKALPLPGRTMTTARQSTPRLGEFVLRSPHEQHELLVCACFAIHHAHGSLWATLLCSILAFGIWNSTCDPVGLHTRHQLPDIRSKVTTSADPVFSRLLKGENTGGLRNHQVAPIVSSRPSFSIIANRNPVPINKSQISCQAK